jgi:hypothetical protein
MDIQAKGTPLLEASAAAGVVLRAGDNPGTALPALSPAPEVGRPAAAPEASVPVALPRPELLVDGGRAALAAPASFLDVRVNGFDLFREDAGRGTRLSSSGGTLREDTTVQTADERPEQTEPPASPLTPRGADLYAGSLPVGVEALDQGLRQFLSQLDDLGQGLGRTLQTSGLTPWVVILGAGVLAGELLRRQQRRWRGALGLAGDAEALSSTWVPGLSDPSCTEEA